MLSHNGTGSSTDIVLLEVQLGSEFGSGLCSAGVGLFGSGASGRLIVCAARGHARRPGQLDRLTKPILGNQRSE